MKQSIKHLLALLTVFGASVTFAADSAYLTTMCQIVAEKEDLYRVVYRSPSEKNVQIRIIDNDNQAVYNENIKATGFIKKFDLTYLPNGEYQMEVRAGEDVFTEDFILGDVSQFHMNVVSREQHKVALVGSDQKGQDMKLYILDDNRDVIYEEKFSNSFEIHKQYDFQQLNSQHVTFLLYHDNNLIKEQRISLQLPVAVLD